MDELNGYSILLDPILKYVLSPETGSEPFLSLLNAFQQRIGKPPMEEIFPWPTCIEKESPDDKLTISDLAARDAQGRIHQVEVQVANHPMLLERNIYSWSRRYGRQLQPGDGYDKLKSVIHILITRFMVFPDLPEIHHEGRMVLKDHPDVLLSDHFEFHVLEISPQKVALMHGEDDLLARWIKLMYYADKKQENMMSELSQADPGIQIALDRYKTYCQDPSLRYMAEVELHKITDVMTAIDCAKVEGLVKGRAEGKAEGMAKGKAEGVAEGMAKGLAEGKTEGQALSVLKVLARKFGRLPEYLPKQILGIQDEAVLDRLFDCAMDSRTLQEFEKTL